MPRLQNGTLNLLFLRPKTRQEALIEWTETMVGVKRGSDSLVCLLFPTEAASQKHDPMQACR